jgi:hypothetical protein
MLFDLAATTAKIGRLLAEELFERGNLDFMIGSSNRGSTGSAAV